MATKGLRERLNDGETVVCAEGYLHVFERRGYLRAGAFVPEVVIEHPQLVRHQYEEFVHAGSDVVLAFTYYAHREKMALIDREKEIEQINRDALRMAREVADKTGTLMAGNICNTNAYKPGDTVNDQRLKEMFKEQVEWAVDAGADFIVAETFSDFGEAILALDVCKQYANGLPVVLTMAWHLNTIDGEPATLDGITLKDTFLGLEAAGVDVLGLNCARGPATMLPLMEKIQKLGLKVPLAALPVPYRTTTAEANFMSLTDPRSGKKIFYENLECALCSRENIHNFGVRAKELGFQYLGVCCGNTSAFTRALCEGLGRTPQASRYSFDSRGHAHLATSVRRCDYIKCDL